MDIDTLGALFIVGMFGVGSLYVSIYILYLSGIAC